MDKLSLNNKVILVTGAAGFIGSNLVKRLLNDLHGATIVGIDNMNAYYDPSLKEYRLKELEALSQRPAVSPQSECPAVSPLSERPTVLPSGNTWTFVKGDIADKPAIDALFAKYPFDIVVNLAAQAGVRYSIENPDAYIQSNMIGFYNILEACRHSKPSATVSEASASGHSSTVSEASALAPSSTTQMTVLLPSSSLLITSLSRLWIAPPVVTEMVSGPRSTV